MVVAFGVRVARADADALLVPEAEGVELLPAVPLAERDALPVSLGVPLGGGVPVCDALRGEGVPLPLRVADEDAEGEEEFRGDTEGAPEAEALVDMDGDTVGEALMLKEMVALALPLAAPLALAQLVAPEDALTEGDKEGVAEPEAVEFPLIVARPLPLMVLLALAQLVAATLADGVKELLLDSVGDVEGVAGREGVAVTHVEGVVLPHAVALGHKVDVADAVRHREEVGVPEGEEVPQGDAEALAHGEGYAEGLPLPVTRGEGELLAQWVCDGVPNGVAEAQGEGVGEPVEDAEPQPVGDADPLRVAHPDVLPLGE